MDNEIITVSFYHEYKEKIPGNIVVTHRTKKVITEFEVESETEEVIYGDIKCNYCKKLVEVTVLPINKKKGDRYFHTELIKNLSLFTFLWIFTIVYSIFVLFNLPILILLSAIPLYFSIKPMLRIRFKFMRVYPTSGFQHRMFFPKKNKIRMIMNE